MHTIIKIIEISYAIIFGAVAVILANVISKIEAKQEVKKYCIYFVFLWYLISLALSINGFFYAPTQFAKGDIMGLLALVVLMLVPLVVFFVVLKLSNLFKLLIYSIDLKFLITIQIYRIMGGIYFFALLHANRAPKIFAIPTGFFDGFIGISALFLGYILIKKQCGSIFLSKLWNYIGLFDFLLAFTIYFLYFPFFILKASPEMIMWAGFYPMPFIVMFIVPLSIILHFLAIKKLEFYVLKNEIHP